jgi:cytochrome c-type biogenesis protein
VELSSLTSGSGIPVISAFVLGLMAAVGPCTMATNIAALAYVSRRVTDRKYCLMTGVLYTIGRMITYSVLGVLIIMVGLEIPGMSIFVQGIGEKALGPFLIAIGILMLFIDKISFGRTGNGLTNIGAKIADWGIIGGLPLGALFALAFCPYSAVLFFAILIPLSLKSTGGITFPAVFAVGTGIPVLLFALVLAFGVSGISKWFDAISKWDRIIRLAMAAVFIGIGVYYMVQWLSGIPG